MRSLTIQNLVLNLRVGMAERYDFINVPLTFLFQCCNVIGGKIGGCRGLKLVVYKI